MKNCRTIPRITNLMSLSSAFAILEDHKECLPWLYSNYILPYSKRGICDYYLTGGDIFGGNPWIKYSISETKKVSGEDIIDHLNFYIGKGQCIYTKIDCKDIFWRHNQIHDIFLVGNDVNRREFLALGPHLAQIPPLCKFFSIPYSLFEAGYTSPLMKKSQLLITLEYNHKCRLGYNETSIKIMISDFLNSRLSKEHFPLYYYPTSGAYDPIDKIEMDDFFKNFHNDKNIIYGSNTYDYLYNQLLNQTLSEIDHRVYRLLIERLKLMRQRVQYYSSIKAYNLKMLQDIIFEYDCMVRNAQILMNYLLKIAIKQDSYHIKEAAKYLVKIKELEISAMEKLLSIF